MISLSFLKLVETIAPLRKKKKEKEMTPGVRAREEVYSQPLTPGLPVATRVLTQQAALGWTSALQIPMSPLRILLSSNPTLLF